VVEDPGGSEGKPFGGWAFKFDRGDDGNKFKMDELIEADAQLLGRVTYEGFAEAWPSRTDEHGFADKMNNMRKYVVSTTLQNPTWNNTVVIDGNVADEVDKLRQESSGNILVAGSVSLAHTLAKHDLVDVYRLMVYPIVLGQGKRLFADGLEQQPLKLVEAKQSADVHTLIYERDR
jgi:dihydrofolate reductase